MMKSEEFDLRAAVVLGSAIDLTERASALLNVNRRTVIRWQAGKARIPDGVEEELRRRTGPRHDLMVRHGLDRWLISFGLPGKGGYVRRYIAHRWPPRFVARFVCWDIWPPDADTEDDALEAVRATGVWVDQWMALADVEWTDPAPDGEDMKILLQEAMEAAAEFRDERGDLGFQSVMYEESLEAMRGGRRHPD